MSSNPASLEDVTKFIDERDASRVTVAVCDLQGQLRGKSFSREKFLSALERGFSLPPVLAVTDFGDVIRDVQVNDTLTHMGDGIARIIPDSAREIPWAGSGRNLLFLAEMSGGDAQLDPRALYRAVEARAGALGHRPMHACEYEFSLYREDHESVHRKGYRDLTPVRHEPDLYGIWRQSGAAEFWEDFTGVMKRLDVGLDACHGELSAGAYEAVISHECGVRAGDSAAVFKAFSKSFAQRHGLLLTFMARVSHQAAGHSGHVHISLTDAAGASAFYDDKGEHGMSDVFAAFIGGLQRCIPELALMLLPNVNSFRRLGESGWSFDARACRWGVDNRTVALRVVPEGPWRTHLEVRIPGADANPYLALACILAAGIWGLQHRAAPGDPYAGNAFRDAGDAPEEISLPRNFDAAVDRFRNSTLARELFGEQFVRVFAETRAAQAEEFRGKVSEWELRRFLESA